MTAAEIGDIYGRGLVTALTRLRDRPAARLLCQCGTSYVARLSDLRRGSVVSCGCKKRENLRGRNHQVWQGFGTREELAWAAGLFDGEGYIGCIERKVSSHGRRVPQLHMTITQWYDPAVLNRFRAAVGMGRIHSRPRNNGTAIEYRWASSGLEIVQASLAMIWPWLSAPKRAQAIRALTAYHGRREVIGVRAWRRRHGN